MSSNEKKNNKLKADALKYHETGRPGKLEVIPTKPYLTQYDLSLAYSPGVAEPCLRIAENPSDVNKYTMKKNLVAVISNGTAVLGLGDIGPEASKPVMEGKGLLFKIFADIDVFDIELDTKDPKKFIETVKIMAPTFGGINLEDIAAPECFEIEEALKETLDIPIMHDDQHGTAIISSAGLINALRINGKKIEDLIIVVNGAGSAAIACSNLYISLGVKRENIIMFDSKGPLRSDRKNLNPQKQQFVTKRDIHTLNEALDGADMFLGLSVAGVLKKEALIKMAPNPIVFALANPVPEIDYDIAVATRPDVIMGTGRSDFPNQINNVLGFPYIFRGALDVCATGINEEMKIAAAYALADLAQKPVPDVVNLAYHSINFSFGKEYIIPKPFDPRLLASVSVAVAKAAIESGIAKEPITDWNAYEEELNTRIEVEVQLIRELKNRARKNPKRVVFSDAENYKMLKAVEIVLQEKLAVPILLGNTAKIEAIIKNDHLEINDVEIIDPEAPKWQAKKEEFATSLWKKRQRNGTTYKSALSRTYDYNYFAPMLVEAGYADAMISGVTRNYIDSLKPAQLIVGKKADTKLITGIYILKTDQGPLFFADTTFTKAPTAEQLVEITRQTEKVIRGFGVEPCIALLSYSNFGSYPGEVPMKIKKAVEILHKENPEIIVDGDVQANVALNQEILKENFPFSKLVGHNVNTFVFPFISAGNISYKLLQEIGKFKVIGPIIYGLNKPIHILQVGATVDDIVNMVTIASIDAQSH